MLEDLNKKLNLDVPYTEVKSKYRDNIISKINDKFSKKDAPVTLIIDNLKEKDQKFLDVLFYMIDALKVIKVILVEKTSE